MLPLPETAVSSRINVTKTYLPPQEEYQRYLTDIWEAGWVTNEGPLVKRLEAQLEDYLGVPHVQFVGNGTVALQLAIKALELKGKIITTPYSYVATLNSIIWENCQPVFVDIDPTTLCINAEQIEAHIDQDTSAILATHVYGYPCDVEAIQSLAKRYDLKVVYDGAHAFGVRVGGQSIFNYGDISTVSFHATKLFHTIEGGAVMTQDPDLAEKVFLHKTFGHRADDYYYASINGKNSEFHAAMGLCNLPMIEDIVARRKEIYQQYQTMLDALPLRILQPNTSLGYNYAYFPVIFATHEAMMGVKEALEAQNIYARRYFYPSLNTLSYHQGAACPMSEDVAQRVLCLPFYHELSDEDVNRIGTTIQHYY